MKFFRKKALSIIIIGVLLASAGLYYLTTKNDTLDPPATPSTSVPMKSNPSSETQSTPVPGDNLEECLSKIPSSFAYDPEIENDRKRCYELYP